MPLQKQYKTILLANGLDTKTNEKFVEDSLLSMENCEILNMKLKKTSGYENIRAKEESDIATAKNILVYKDNLVAIDGESTLFYNNQEKELYQTSIQSYCQQDEITLVSNINTTDFNTLARKQALPYPLSTYSADNGASYTVLIPQPMTASYGDYQFTIMYDMTASTPTYNIILTDLKRDMTIYTQSLITRQQYPLDVVCTPVGAFFYMINLNNFTVDEYFVSYDLSSIFTFNSSNIKQPFSLNIFNQSILFFTPSDVPNLTNYCHFLTTSYDNGFIYFAFRVGTIAAWNGTFSARNTSGGEAYLPVSVTPSKSINSNIDSQSLACCVFKNKNNSSYFATLFSNELRIFDVYLYALRLSHTENANLDFMSHSISYNYALEYFVILKHDLKEYNNTTPTPNTRTPFCHIYGFSYLPNTGDLDITISYSNLGVSDPRRITDTYGTAILAGNVFCYYDRIYFPIVYYPYHLTATEETTTKQEEIRASIHLVQYVLNLSFEGVWKNTVCAHVHVSIIKNLSSAIYVNTSNRLAFFPALFRTKQNVTIQNQISYSYYGLSNTTSLKGKIIYNYDIKTTSIRIPEINNLEFYQRGNNTYYGDSSLLEISSRQITEVNFFDFPQVSLQIINNGTNPALSNGVYTYACIYEYQNGNGDVVRSAPSILKTAEITGSDKNVTINLTPQPYFSYKYNIVKKIYRSLSNGTTLYLLDQTNALTYIDSASDSAILGNEFIYTTGGILGEFCFPALQSFVLHKNRIFGISSENRNQIYYSKSLTPGVSLAANPFLYFTVESKGGPCIKLESMDDKLIIFKEDYIYFVVGDGALDNGTNSSLSEAEIIVSPVGCKAPESVVRIPTGIIFSSKKGLWILTRSLQTEYIGANVEKYNDLNITSSVLLKTTNKVKFTTDGGITLTYDYYYDNWSVETNLYFVDTVIQSDSLYTISKTGKIYRQTPDVYLRDSSFYSQSFTTGWVRLAGIHGFQRAYKCLFLGKIINTHVIKVSVYYDYVDTTSEFHYFNPLVNNETGDSTLGIASSYGEYILGDVQKYGGPDSSTYQFRLDFERQLCSSIKLKIEDLFIGSKFDDGSSFEMDTITFEIGIISGVNKLGSKLTV